MKDLVSYSESKFMNTFKFWDSGDKNPKIEKKS